MIDFEHGALHRKGEPELAGFFAHAVMDHRDARAFSFLSGAAALDLEQWLTVIEAEVQRRRLRRQDLDRAVRRLRAIVDEDAGTPLRSWIVFFIQEVGFQVKRDCGAGADEQDVSERTYRAIIGMLTAASFAYCMAREVVGLIETGQAACLGTRPLGVTAEGFDSVV